MGISVWGVDPHDHELLSHLFDIAESLVMEIEFLNDVIVHQVEETPEHRWTRIREWASSNIIVQDT